ncbi:MAG: biotin--[acetyl-CoA-carboxylase] ligase, partial [Bacteroidales bacterium]|nr:biotin--[acetyl-CoA-carboxylase] ligase [Bacteroidales bacterium]
MNYKLITVNKLNSTNNYAQKLLKKNSNSESFVVWAKNQTAGRGLRENKWWSSVGESLTFSLVLQKMDFPIDKVFLLNMISSLAIHRVIEKYTKNVWIKWPNDIYVNNKKIAGLLIENTIRASNIITSIIGCGININQMKFPEYLSSATSLGLITEKKFNLSNLLNEFLDSFSFYFEKRNQIQFLFQEYYSVLLGFEQLSTYSDKNG